MSSLPPLFLPPHLPSSSLIKEPIPISRRRNLADQDLLLLLSRCRSHLIRMHPRGMVFFYFFKFIGGTCSSFLSLFFLFFFPVVICLFICKVYFGEVIDVPMNWKNLGFLLLTQPKSVFYNTFTYWTKPIWICLQCVCINDTINQNHEILCPNYGHILHFGKVGPTPTCKNASLDGSNNKIGC